MTGKGHLWSGSVTLASCTILEYYVVHPGIDKLIIDFRENHEFNNVFVTTLFNIYDKFCSYFTDLNFFKIVILIAGFCCFYLGLLLPDIDLKNSTISKILHFHLPFRHRGVTHTIYWVILFDILGFVISPIFLFLGQGYFIHLFFDSFSVAGTCWLYPFSKYRVYNDTVMTRRFHIKLYDSEGISEIVVNIVVSIIAVLIIAFIIMMKGGLISA